MKNTQALRVVNGLGAQKWGNCRGGELDNSKENGCEPLPKRHRQSQSRPLGLS